MTPKATNSIAGGNATGMEENTIPTLKGSNIDMNSTLTGSEPLLSAKPVALPPAHLR